MGSGGNLGERFAARPISSAIALLVALNPASRGQFGQQVADGVVLESLHFLNPNSKFVDGVEALKTTADQLSAQPNMASNLKAVIDAAFAERSP